MKTTFFFLIAFCLPFLAMAQTQSDMTVELVVFETLDTHSEQEVLEAAQNLHSFLAEQPGFISRSLSRSADGKWVDVVFWESLAQAQAASEKAMKSPICQPFFEVIEQESMLFMHSEGKLTFEK